MLGRKERDQLELFMAGLLRQLIPDDHVLVRVDAVLDLSWLRGEIADFYCPDNGRPSIDPEVAVRLMLAGFLLGIVHDRRLMREAAVNIAIRWFVGYGVHEALPDHSSLTRIRQRWGAQRFRQIFELYGPGMYRREDRNRRGRPHRRVIDPRSRQLGGACCPSHRGCRRGRRRGAS